MEQNLETLQEFELYKNQITTLSENLELIGASLIELGKVKEGLKSLKEAEVGSEILVPMGPDSFINAKVTDTKNVIIGLGSGVSAKKDIDEAIKDMELRITGLEKVRKQSTEKLQFVTKKYEEIAPQIQKIVEKVQNEG